MGFCNVQPLHCPYKGFTTTEKKILQERKERIKRHYWERQSFEVWLVSLVCLIAHFYLVLANWQLNTILIMLALEKEEYLVSVSCSNFLA